MASLFKDLRFIDLLTKLLGPLTSGFCNLWQFLDYEKTHTIIYIHVYVLKSYNSINS